MCGPGDRFHGAKGWRFEMLSFVKVIIIIIQEDLALSRSTIQLCLSMILIVHLVYPPRRCCVLPDFWGLWKFIILQTAARHASNFEQKHYILQIGMPNFPGMLPRRCCQLTACFVEHNWDFFTEVAVDIIEAHRYHMTCLDSFDIRRQSLAVIIYWEILLVSSFKLCYLLISTH